MFLNSFLSFSLCTILLLTACTSTRISMNTPSERSIKMLNNEMNNSTTKVYLKDGKTLKKGTFHIISDSLVHVTPNLIKKYHISKIKSIRTVGNHSSTTFMGISMVVGGVIIFDSVFEGIAIYEAVPTTNHSNRNEMDDSRILGSSNRMKGNLLGWVISTSGFIITLNGIKKATKIYSFD